jgi:hypothetical protein
VLHALQLLANKYFEQFVLVAIIISSVQLALDSYGLDPASQLSKVLAAMDIIFCILFGVEMLIKLAVLGIAFNGPQSYFRSPWNWLDFLIVVIQVLVLTLESSSHAQLPWMHAFRALRSVSSSKLHAELTGNMPPRT